MYAKVDKKFESCKSFMTNKAMAKHVMPLFFQISSDLDSKNSRLPEFHSHDGIMVSQLFFIKIAKFSII